MSLEGEVTLHDPLQTSTVNAYLRFKFSDAFLQKAGAVQAILQVAGAQGKRPDGFYGVRLGGRLGQMSPPVLTPVSPIVGTALPSRPAGGRPAIAPSMTASASVQVPAAPMPAAAPPPPPPPQQQEAPCAAAASSAASSSCRGDRAPRRACRGRRRRGRLACRAAASRPAPRRRRAAAPPRRRRGPAAPPPPPAPWTRDP